MADVQRYRDPATGNLFTLTAEDAAKLGYELVEGEGEEQGQSADEPSSVETGSEAPAEEKAEADATEEDGGQRGTGRRR